MSIVISTYKAEWVYGSSKVSTPGHLYLLWKSSDCICAEFSRPQTLFLKSKNVSTEKGVASQESTLIDENENEHGTIRAENISSTKTTDLTDHYCMALRKWINLYPAMLFKCIVANNQLLAISQKNTSASYKHLLDRKNEILVW